MSAKFPAATPSPVRRPGEASRQSETLFQLLVESVEDYAIFMLDPSGCVMSWNSGAKKIKGYTADEVLGVHFSRFYPPEDVTRGRCAEALEIAKRDGRVEDEGWRIRKDGSRFWANAVITAIHDEKGELVGFAKVTRDLTERRRADEERARLAEAQEANRLKDEFLATVSHELRTPLNAITGWAAILSSERRADAEMLRKAVEVIRRNAELQANLIDDILDMSRIVAGKMRLDVKLTAMDDIVRDAIEVVRPAADAKEIAITIGRMDRAMLVGDPGRLQQVAWNLLSNAIKFMDTGGSVFIDVGAEGSRVTLTVRDTGRGIDPAFLPFLFDPFRQADASITRRFGGLGLGLAIVRHIVELHGGSTRAESAGHGQGATFEVVIPVRAAIPPAPPDAASLRREPEVPATPRWEAKALEGLRVIVIDDDPDALDLFFEILQAEGARVHTAASAEEARKLTDTVKPNLFISDLGMQDEDRFTWVRRLRRRPADKGGTTPAIALSAYARESDRLRALEAGFDEHVAKPVHPEVLLSAIERVLRVRRRRHEGP